MSVKLRQHIDGFARCELVVGKDLMGMFFYDENDELVLSARGTAALAIETDGNHLNRRSIRPEDLLAAAKLAGALAQPPEQDAA